MLTQTTIFGEALTAPGANEFVEKLDREYNNKEDSETSCHFEKFNISESSWSLKVSGITKTFNVSHYLETVKSRTDYSKTLIFFAGFNEDASDKNSNSKKTSRKGGKDDNDDSDVILSMSGDELATSVMNGVTLEAVTRIETFFTKDEKEKREASNFIIHEPKKSDGKLYNVKFETELSKTMKQPAKDLIKIFLNYFHVNMPNKFYAENKFVEYNVFFSLKLFDDRAGISIEILHATDYLDCNKMDLLITSYLNGNVVKDIFKQYYNPIVHYYLNGDKLVIRFRYPHNTIPKKM